MVGVLALILIGVILGLAWVVKAVLGGRRKNLRNVQSNETETQ
jgi:flagellar biogenesis protein FliO